MENNNKQAVINAIWNNPQTVFGCSFRQRRNYLVSVGGEYGTGGISLSLNPEQTNIRVFGNSGSGIAGISDTRGKEGIDIFTYLQDYVLKTSGFKETLIEAAKLYNIPLELSKEQREALTRSALSREVAQSLIQALQENQQGATARYITEVRGLRLDGVHFGELTPDSLRRAKEFLKQHGKTYSEEDFKALQLTEHNANNGYTCVIPYYCNGHVQGFILRNTRPNLPQGTPRYLYSIGLGRNGYCDTLEQGTPAKIVEGQMDAIRLIQAGYKNVIAMGGAKVSNEIGALLKSREISQVTYIPDLEYNEQGEKKTKIIKEAIKGFQAAQVDGKQVINVLDVSEIPTPEGVNLKGLKIDADTYGKEHTAADLEGLVLLDAEPWYMWEFNNLLENYRKKGMNAAQMEDAIRGIYTRCGNPFERQRIRQYVAGKDVKPIFEPFGITPRSLDDVDEWNRNRAYNNAVKENAAALNKAIEEQATPETIRAIVSQLNEAQANNTREEWERQLNQTFEDELDAIRNQPETLKTKWELGNIDKANQFRKYADIEFYPADIAVFCAPTSHGKTMILFNAALDAVRKTDKTYLYVSCEENNRQLLERALNIFIDIPTTATGKEPNGQYCFKEQTRRKSIKAAIRGVVPSEYVEFMGVSEHWNALNKRIQGEIQRYKQDIRPRLKLIHTDATTESICNNVLRVVQDYAEQGIEVGGVFVDYMQLLTTEGKQYSRHDELKDICKALKDCAAELELPVIIAAQFNREALKTSIDEITVANIGEGADIERIAHDIYLLWQIDKTPLYPYYSNKTGTTETGLKPARNKMGERACRIFENTAAMGLDKEYELKRGYMYVEHIKARDNKTGGWALLPFNGERNCIEETDINKMKQE